MIVNTESEKPRWNVFARTLEDMLANPQHGKTPLSQLDNLHERPGEELRPDDHNSPYELVHREKVRRLLISLSEPGTFPALNRDDVERIARYFHFSDAERRRLSAAMLATHIQRVVYERFGEKNDALRKVKAATLAVQIVSSMLPTFEQALAQLGDDGAAFRQYQPTPQAKETMSMSAMPNEDRYYAALAPALDAIDRATLAIQLSYAASVSAERLAQARTARDAYSDALAELDEQTAAIRASDIWQAWHDEARHGYDEADERVIDLGG